MKLCRLCHESEQTAHSTLCSLCHSRRQEVRRRRRSISDPIIYRADKIKNSMKHAVRVGRVVEVDPLLMVRAYIAELLSDHRSCSCCGVAFDYGLLDLNTTPTFDRVDNARGYTIDNIAVICYRCNVLKSNASASELTAVAAYQTSMEGARDALGCHSGNHTRSRRVGDGCTD